MSNMNDRQRKTLTPLILIHQGGYFCGGCKKEPEELIQIGVLPKLYIDHIDNDNSNNKLENLQFLCVSCNTKKNHPRADQPKTSTNVDPVFTTSKLNMSRAREYVMGLMIDPKGSRPEYQELIDDMAEFLDNSQQACKSYLAKMTSKKHGLYEWRVGQHGSSYLHFKDDEELDRAVGSKS